MSKYLLLIFLVFSSFLITARPIQTSQDKVKKTSLSKLIEFHERNGLPNLFHKISSQRQIKIAYLGGSITEASDGWRDLTFNWFRLNFPHTAFYQLNSTIGGTGSLLGVFRLDSLLSKKPDLIFVEFAINDENEMSVGRRLQSMEGIVRKTWEALPNTDILFVYTTAVKVCNLLIQGGRQFDAVLDHEIIANHYGIPSIDMGIEVARLHEKGELLLAADPSENEHSIVFFKNSDHYHPLTESGHPIYAGTVVKYLKKMSKNTDAKKHVLSAPYQANNWEKSHFVYPEQTELHGNWVKLADNQKDQFGVVPCLWIAGPGATMKFKFEGDELGLFDCVGPGTGTIDVVIDGQKQEVKRFDLFCSYWRRNSIFLNKLTAGVHDVEITVTGKEFDKKSVMKPNDDPIRYARFDWYPIGLLITGKLVK